MTLSALLIDVALLVLIVLCLLAIGHLHNRLDILTRRHNALLVSVMRPGDAP